MPGVMVNIVADDTDTIAFVVPNNRLFKAKKVEVNNLAGTDARVRCWDTFTDTDAGVHTSALLQVKVFDYIVPANDAIVVEVDKRMMSTIVLQADCAGIAGATPVVVAIDGDWEV